MGFTSRLRGQLLLTTEYTEYTEHTEDTEYTEDTEREYLLCGL
jgi:hypothetical protein